MVQAASSRTVTAEGLGGSQVKASEICCERMVMRQVIFRLSQCAVLFVMSQCRQTSQLDILQKQY